jgi:hypothetical protein
MSKENYDWRFENSIQYDKKYQETEGVLEHYYTPWRTNYILSNHIDTILFANEMNLNSFLDDKLQYDFLYYSVPSKKRFFKKKSNNKKNAYFSLIQEHYKYNNERTREILSLLTEQQLKMIKNKIEEGDIR